MITDKLRKSLYELEQLLFMIDCSPIEETVIEMQKKYLQKCDGMVNLIYSQTIKSESWNKID